MKKILLLFSILLFFTKASSRVVLKHEVNCEDFGLNWILESTFSRNKPTFNVKFYLATNTTINPLPIDSDHTKWEPIRTNFFDPMKKTYIVIHGYMSSGHKDWVVNIKNAILETNKFNVIIVDWSEGCNTLNYVAAAKDTVYTGYQISKFLYKLKEEVEKWYQITSNDVSIDIGKYSRLYIVGHSLGAHIAGQLSSWLSLRTDNFFKLEKITGLDPAGPCFTNTSKEAQLDKDDADFVEVIHTQHDEFFSLGSSRPLGTIDFYVNGGAIQPECKSPKSKWDYVHGAISTVWWAYAYIYSYFHGTYANWNGRVCSHKIAYKYFLESFHHYHTKECRFEGHPWDGSYNKAYIIFNAVARGKKCETCPEMGYGSSKSSGSGKYLVITSSQEPYCHLKNGTDYDQVKSVIEELKVPDEPVYE